MAGAVAIHGSQFYVTGFEDRGTGTEMMVLNGFADIQDIFDCLICITLAFHSGFSDHFARVLVIT